MHMKTKPLALLLALLMCLSLCPSVLAEDTVALIGGITTTQVFSDEAVKEEDLETIVRSGLAAASAINQQPWYFAVITSKDVMLEIGGSEGGQRASLGASPAAIVLYKVNGSKSPIPILTAAWPAKTW